MTLRTVTATTKDTAGEPDNTEWVFVSELRGADGEIITTRPRTVRPVAGQLTVQLEPGPTIVQFAGRKLTILVPDEDADLWDLIEAAIAYPPNTPQDRLNAAVGQYVETNREQFRTRAVPVDPDDPDTLYQWVDSNGDDVGDPVELADIVNVGWGSVLDKPTVIGAGSTQAAARSALGATTVGGNVFTAADKAAARLAVGALFSRPSAFTFDYGFQVWWDGQRFRTDYDVSIQRNKPTNVLRVHTVNGNNTSGDGSAAKPYKTLNYVLGICSDGDEIRIVNPGINFRSQGANLTISKSINIVIEHPESTLFVTTDLLTWTANGTYPNVYEASRTNVVKVVDIAADPDGGPLVRVADLATCDSTRGSWYQATDGTGKVYVHMIDHSAPNPTTLFPLVTETWFKIDSTGRSTAQRVYLEGFRLVGGTVAVEVTGAIAAQTVFAQKNCAWLNMGYGTLAATTDSGLDNGLSILGNVVSYSQDCLIGYSGRDGYNYHAKTVGGTTYIPKFVEIDCEGRHCGVDDRTQGLSPNATMNGSTSHEGVLGIRIGGKYWHCYGPPVCDVHPNTKTVNLSCEAGWTTASSSLVKGAWMIQATDTSNDAEMWMFNCTGYGAQYGFYPYLGGHMHYDSTCDATTGGPGSLVLETL